jgi:hypothetical protein
MERMRPLADIRSSVTISVDSYPRPLSADSGADGADETDETDETDAAAGGHPFIRYGIR